MSDLDAYEARLALLRKQFATVLSEQLIEWMARNGYPRAEEG